MSRTSRRAAWLAAWGAVLTVAGCTGVPSSSPPRTVEPIDIGNRSVPAQPGPAAGADPRTIVQEFLGANAVDAANFDTAREYLAGSARAEWSANAATTTILSGQSVGTAQNGVVQVRGRVVGSLNQNGVYTPQLQGTGDGGPVNTFTFRLARVKGENRIVGLPESLLLTTEQFSDYYRPHNLYFFDQTRRHLVPDTRWSALEGPRLASWLMGQLTTGPRSDLSSAVLNDTLPQPSARRITVGSGTPIRIDIPGAAQLDSRGRSLLAAQIGATVTDPTSDEQLEITDGGNAVPVSGGGSDFTAREAAYDYTPVSPPADVFFLRNGEIVRAPDGDAPGKLRDSPFFLDSIAVTQLGTTSDYTVAAVSGTGERARLYLGTEDDGYRATSVSGVLSRPAWLPAGSPGATSPSEVWIGVGSRLLRLTVTGNRATSSAVSIGPSGGRVVAVRLSPEGSRIALVIQSTDGSRRLYLGTIVRAAGQVRVDSLQEISPDGVTVNDAAWIGSQKLLAIGSIVASGDARIFETSADGSLWKGRTIGSVLPGPPDSVTVAVSQLAWVSVNGTVWRQSGGSWTSPGTADQVTGYDPVYLE